MILVDAINLVLASGRPAIDIRRSPGCPYLHLKFLISIRYHLAFEAVEEYIALENSWFEVLAEFGALIGREVRQQGSS